MRLGGLSSLLILGITSANDTMADQRELVQASDAGRPVNAVEFLTALNGEQVFRQTCQVCHSGIIGSRAPTPKTLAKLPVDAIIHALTVGTMRSVGSTLSGAERRAVAEYVSATKNQGGDQIIAAAYCRQPLLHQANANLAEWHGWGGNIKNQSFSSARDAGIAVKDLASLKLKWAFGFPDSFSAWAQPVVVGGRVFVGSQSGLVFALDAKTGCILWQFEAQAGVRGAINTGPLLAGGQPSSELAIYFGDMAGHAYGLNAQTGALLWTVRLDEHPKARVTGSPVLYENTLYVPMSSWQTVDQVETNCCTFRGSVSAVDVSSGKVLWKTHTIAQEPELTGKQDQAGHPLYGPSGSSVWQALTIDEKRRRLYAGTGNSYTGPAVNSNSILAFELDSGNIIWSRQMTANDIWIAGCAPKDATCSYPNGENLDISTAPVLAELADGKQFIVVGQKSGWVYAFDPDKNGVLQWSYRAAQGSGAGGIVWGLAADRSKVYVPVSDITSANPGGIHALDLRSGKPVWHAPPIKELLCGVARYGCNAAQPVGLTVIPGVVFAGAVDGGFRAYDSTSGKILWQYDTNQQFVTVNGIKANGGSLMGAGPSVVNGMVFVNSGYGTNGGRPGNVLLAFGIDEK